MKSKRRRHRVKQLITKSIASLAFSASFFIGYPSIYAQNHIQGVYQSNRIVRGCGICQSNQRYWYPAPVATPQYYPAPQNSQFAPVVQPATYYPNVVNEHYGATQIVPLSTVTPVEYPSYPIGEVILGQPSTMVVGEMSFETTPVSEYPMNSYSGEIIGYPIEGIVTSESDGAIETIAETEPILSSPSDIDSSGATANPDAAAKLAEDLKRSEEEVAGLQTVVADLKVELKSANERVYATERNAKTSIAKAQKLAATMEQRVKEAEKEMVRSNNELTQLKNEYQQKVKEVESLRMKGDSKADEQQSIAADLKKQLEKLRRQHGVKEKQLEEKLSSAVRDLKQAMAKVSSLEARNAEALAALKAADAKTKLVQAQNEKLAQEKSKAAASKNKKSKESDAQNRIDTLASEAKAKDKKPAPAKKKPTMKGKEEGAKKEDNKKPSNSKSASDQPKGDKKKPGKYNAEEQIAKLEKSMNRQIDKAEKEVNSKLEKELKALKAEGISKEHPKAAKLINEMKSELDQRVKEIRSRVQERIKRIGAEAARRRAS